MVYVLSANENLRDVVCAAIKHADVFQTAKPSDLVHAILARAALRHICVIVDLSTVANATDLIRLLQGSPPAAVVPVIVLGTTDQIDSLREVQDRIKGIVTVPYTPMELAAVVMSIC